VGTWSLLHQQIIRLRYHFLLAGYREPYAVIAGPPPSRRQHVITVGEGGWGVGVEEGIGWVAVTSIKR
jgi:hypothetical protein